ncbi:hypothetical protein A2U01_0063176, partial [Trifolium medium]|nr:hypothetical protein [Trifolium medium]
MGEFKDGESSAVVDDHRFKGKVEICWMCLEISVTEVGNCIEVHAGCVRRKACPNPSLATSLGAGRDRLGAARAHPGLSTACYARRRPMVAGRAYEHVDLVVADFV